MTTSTGIPFVFFTALLPFYRHEHAFSPQHGLVSSLVHEETFFFLAGQAFTSGTFKYLSTKY